MSVVHQLLFNCRYYVRLRVKINCDLQGCFIFTLNFEKEKDVMLDVEKKSHLGLKLKLKTMKFFGCHAKSVM